MDMIFSAFLYPKRTQIGVVLV